MMNLLIYLLGQKLISCFNSFLLFRILSIYQRPSSHMVRYLQNENDNPLIVRQKLLNLLIHFHHNTS